MPSPDLIGGQAGQAHHQLGQGGQGAGGWRERRRHLSGLSQGDYDGRGQQTASPMFTAIMSGGVGISGRELYKCR